MKLSFQLHVCSTSALGHDVKCISYGGLQSKMFEKCCTKLHIHSFIHFPNPLCLNFYVPKWFLLVSAYLNMEKFLSSSKFANHKFPEVQHFLLPHSHPWLTWHGFYKIWLVSAEFGAACLWSSVHKPASTEFPLVIKWQKKCAHSISTLLGDSPHWSHSTQITIVLICHLLAATSDGRDTEENIFPAVCHTVRGPCGALVPRQPLGRDPVDMQMIISRGKCWVFFTSVAIHSSSLGTLSKASSQTCSLKHRFLLLMKTY